MYPHERSLVQRLANKPFALLGINSDPDREKLKETMKEKGITWRSWYDQNTSGPIATQWNVHGWPTIYVLDAKGVIRYKNVRERELDEAVDKLLAEAEGGE
ncbi:MAG: TlpA family protein disulfide reductase [Planctomycetes bacterium]|nr:TlpA family protein disulfide reductase [Planctomycetota bacterium]